MTVKFAGSRPALEGARIRARQGYFARYIEDEPSGPRGTRSSGEPGPLAGYILQATGFRRPAALRAYLQRSWKFP